MSVASVSVHNGVAYTLRPIVCEHHRQYDGSTAPVTIECGMGSVRGLICPICYRPARLATDDEARDFLSRAYPYGPS